MSSNCRFLSLLLNQNIVATSEGRRLLSKWHWISKIYPPSIFTFFLSSVFILPRQRYIFFVFCFNIKKSAIFFLIKFGFTVEVMRVGLVGKLWNHWHSHLYGKRTKQSSYRRGSTYVLFNPFWPTRQRECVGEGEREPQNNQSYISSKKVSFPFGEFKCFYRN